MVCEESMFPKRRNLTTGHYCLVNLASCSYPVGNNLYHAEGNLTEGNSNSGSMKRGIPNYSVATEEELNENLTVLYFDFFFLLTLVSFLNTPFSVWL